MLIVGITGGSEEGTGRYRSRSAGVVTVLGQGTQDLGGEQRGRYET